MSATLHFLCNVPLVRKKLPTTKKAMKTITNFFLKNLLIIFYQLKRRATLFSGSYFKKLQITFDALLSPITEASFLFA